MVQRRRSLATAASDRLFATAVAFVYTGQFASSAKTGVTAAVAKTGLYCVWERLWKRIDWGLEDA